MKKLILIFALFVSSNVKAQPASYPTVNIWEIEKDTVFLGDSLFVGIKFLAPSISPYHDTCSFYLYSSLSSTIPYLWRGDYNSFYSLPKYTHLPWATTDSVYKKYLHIPSVFATGPCRIYSTNGTPQYVNIYILDPNDTIVTPPINTGINEYNESKSIKEVHYYNLSGQEILKPKEGLFICRTIYSDKTIKTTKIYETRN